MANDEKDDQMTETNIATSVMDGNRPLEGLRVLDMTRLAPGPYASMLLADLGADVLAIGGGRTGLPVPVLSRGKKFTSLDLKSSEGKAALHHLVADADVVMEGYRPGVAKRLGAGYEELRSIKPDVIYCSLTGYGQDGPMAQRAGHDINYLAMAGALGAMGPKGEPPIPPLNLVADFGGGSLFAVIGILSALHARERTGEGAFIDVAMIDGVRSLMGMNFADWGTPTLPGRGMGILTGEAPFYRCYECSDNLFVAVGALENAFFETLWRTLDLGDIPDHLDRGNWSLIESRLSEVFRSRTRQEWEMVFAEVDACVTPVLQPHEVGSHPQTSARDPQFDLNSPSLAPRFTKAPQKNSTDSEPASKEVLMSYGLPATVADNLLARIEHTEVTGLSWPPL